MIYLVDLMLAAFKAGQRTINFYQLCEGKIFDFHIIFKIKRYQTDLLRSLTKSTWHLCSTALISISWNLHWTVSWQSEAVGELNVNNVRHLSAVQLKSLSKFGRRFSGITRLIYAKVERITHAIIISTRIFPNLCLWWLMVKVFI